jgi:hypothetical protein
MPTLKAFVVATGMTSQQGHIDFVYYVLRPDGSVLFSQRGGDTSATPGEYDDNTQNLHEKIAAAIRADIGSEGELDVLFLDAHGKW